MVTRGRLERCRRRTARAGVDGHGGQPAADFLPGMRRTVQIAPQHLLANALGGGVKVTEARRHAARPPLASGDLCRESATFGQGSRASLLVDVPRDEMALLIELVVHLGVN